MLELLQQCNDSELFSIEGYPVYLIPQTWFEQWKKYTFFHEQLSDANQMDDEEE